jgi:hypothetical protein
MTLNPRENMAPMADLRAHFSCQQEQDEKIERFTGCWAQSNSYKLRRLISQL